MKDEIKITYRDHLITYHEDANEWRCASFANHRGSPSLVLAKARVDKMLDTPEGKPKPFEKFQVWTTAFSYGNDWKKATITGRAEAGELWAVCGKERKKLRSYDVAKLCLDRPKNDQLVKDIEEIERKMESLRKEKNNLEEHMTKYKP